MVQVAKSDTLWDVFRATGYIGAYLLYCETQKSGETEESLAYEIEEVAGI